MGEKEAEFRTGPEVRTGPLRAGLRGRGSVGVRAGTLLRKSWQGEETSDAPAALCKAGGRKSGKCLDGGRNLLGAASEEGSAKGSPGRAGQGGRKLARIGYLLTHCSEPHLCPSACSKPHGRRGTGWGEAPGGGGRGQRRAGSLSQASSRCKMS